jgi:membrane complex biogenesis BtpA family protein
MHGIIVENFGDAPFFPTDVPPETVAALTRVAQAIRDEAGVPVGVNVLRNDTRAAIAVATAARAAFVRVNVHIGAAWTDQGLIQGRAHETLRLRRQLAPDLRIFADVRVKHATPVTPRPLVEEAKDCLARGKADAIIMTGRATGTRVDLDEAREVRRALPDAPLFIGSGVSIESVRETLRVADGVIVGTEIKVDGVVTNPVDEDRVRRLVDRSK